MKFKTIYILFNAVIAVSFAFIFLLPLALLGPEYFRIFAARNWLAAVLFLATLVIINGYFLANWKLFRLLEREDWPQLMGFLEDRIYRRGSFRRNYCRMLINAYLITANAAKTALLEAKVREKKPQLLKAMALQFGLPYLLKNDPQAAQMYFGGLLDESGLADRGWIRWNYAFSLMQQKQYAQAKSELTGLLAERPEPVLQLLAVYMLDSYSQAHPDVRPLVQQGRGDLRKRFSAEQWKRKIEDGGRNTEVTLLAPILREAREWLWSEGAHDGQGGQNPSEPGPEPA